MTQISGNQIKDGAIDNNKVAAGAGIETTKLADGGSFVKKEGTVPFTGDQSMGGNKLTNLGTPNPGSSDAATTSYVDNAIAALNSLFDSKPSVRVASTGNVNISNPGTSTFDGITISSGDRVLLKNQSTTSQNGIYVFNGSSSPMTRATDMDAWTEVPGAFVAVEEGSTNADTIWLCSADQGGTLGSSAIAWQQIPTTAGLLNSNFVVRETPSGSINGSNTSFSLANSPVVGSEELYLNGLLQEQGAGKDYTISGTTITMAAAPVSGDVLKVSYRK